MPRSPFCMWVTLYLVLVLGRCYLMTAEEWIDFSLNAVTLRSNQASSCLYQSCKARGTFQYWAFSSEAHSRPVTGMCVTVPWSLALLNISVLKCPLSVYQHRGSGCLRGIHPLEEHDVRSRSRQDWHCWTHESRLYVSIHQGDQRKCVKDTDGLFSWESLVLWGQGFTEETERNLCY